MRAKLKLKGTDIFVGDDFSKNVRDIRKKLSPFLKKAKEEKKLCKMVFDHLVMEGKRYVYDPHRGHRLGPDIYLGTRPGVIKTNSLH
nr:hypothetical protein BaRGS_017937 [Batillaria attramentaria]